MISCFCRQNVVYFRAKFKKQFEILHVLRILCVMIWHFMRQTALNRPITAKTGKIYLKGTF
jgi:hypothetical protein